MMHRILFVVFVLLWICSRVAASDDVCGRYAINCQTSGWPVTLQNTTRPEGAYSSLLRYAPRQGTVNGVIRVDEQFLSAVELLYNNEEQIRVLLTLLRSDQAPAWMRLMRGYEDCVTDTSVFTCVQNRCREADLAALPYENTIFTEDVMGFEITSNPFSMSVILRARNAYTGADRAIRLPRVHIGLFDALFNIVRQFFLDRRVTDAPIIRKLASTNRDINSQYREKLSLSALVRS